MLWVLGYVGFEFRLWGVESLRLRVLSLVISWWTTTTCCFGVLSFLTVPVLGKYERNPTCESGPLGKCAIEDFTMR